MSNERFKLLRKKLFNSIDKSLEEDGHHKSYEGTFKVTTCYPNRFEDTSNGNELIPDYYKIELYCYVIGPSRHYAWNGKTFEEALNKCEKDILEWIGNA